MGNSGKISPQRFTSLIPKCSLGNAAVNRSRRLCQACFSHQHPAWHIVDCQQMYLTILESWCPPRTSCSSQRHARFGSSGPCSWQRTCCGRCCASSVSSLAIKASIPRRFLSAFRSPLSGMSLAGARAPGQSSPDKLVTLLLSSHQPVALQPAS